MKWLLTLLVTLSVFHSPAQAQSLSYEEMLASAEYQQAGELLEGLHDTKGQGQNVIKFLAENRGIRTFLLQKMLQVRCERYMNFLEEIRCSQALWTMIGQLDFDVKIIEGGQGSNWRPQSFLFVAFKQQLISLLQNPRTEQFLNTVMMKMAGWRADATRNRFNLWDVARQFYRDERLAATVLAVLFQDTSVSQTHVVYLGHEGIRGNATYKKNLDLLNSTLAFMSDVLSSDATGFNKAMYPAGFAGQVNNNPYHFYVPWYLATRLSLSGYGPKYAVAAPTILSTTYEFVTTKNDFTYLYSDPKIITNAHTVRDIYAGYMGARLGAGLKTNAPLLGTLRGLFARSTDDAMEALFDAL